MKSGTPPADANTGNENQWHTEVQVDDLPERDVDQYQIDSLEAKLTDLRRQQHTQQQLRGRASHMARPAAPDANNEHEESSSDFETEKDKILAESLRDMVSGTGPLTTAQFELLKGLNERVALSEPNAVETESTQTMR